MTVYAASIGPKPQYELSTGVPMVGGLLYFYVAGSVGTKQNTYTDSTGAVANPNPITLNALGMPPNEIWFTSGQLYKIVLAPAGDTDPPTSPIFTLDNQRGQGDTTSSVSEWTSLPFTPTYVSATSFSVLGDQTSTLKIGRRVRSTVTAGTIYSTIFSAAYAIGVTTVVVINDSGVLDTGISAVSYGFLASDNLSLPFTKFNVGWVAAGGTASAITASYVPTNTFLSDGLTLAFRAPGANTIAAPTFSPDSLTAHPITQAGGSALNIGQITGANCECVVRYNLANTRWELISPAGSGTGSSLVLIQTQSAATSATVDFTTGITSLYEAMVLTMSDVVPATNGANLWFRISTDSGSTWASSASNYAHTLFVGIDTANPVGAGSTGDTKTVIGGSLNNADTYSATLTVFAPSGTSRGKIWNWQFGHTSSANIIVSGVGSGKYIATAAAVNGIRLMMSSGNITAGTFSLYGIRK